MMKIIGELKAERVHDLNQIGGLQEENARLKAEVEGIKQSGYSIFMLQGKLTQKCQDYLEVQKQNEANVQLVRNLKAEVEELKSQPDPLTAYLYADTLRRDDIKTLKAHIERLTKAGDAMASSIQFNEEMSQDYNGPTIVHQSVQRWNAAKEGKQS